MPNSKYSNVAKPDENYVSEEELKKEQFPKSSTRERLEAAKKKIGKTAKKTNEPELPPEDLVSSEPQDVLGGY